MEWNSNIPRFPPTISATCQVYDVTPIPPDPVENIVITFQQVISEQQIGRTFITLHYTWRAPDFQGEGINGYQVWLNREPAPIIATGGFRQIGQNAMNDELRMVFNESDTNFTLYFQVRVAYLIVYMCVCLYVMYLHACLCRGYIHGFLSTDSSHQC